MSRSSSTVEDRLASYRPTLDEAIARRTSQPASDARLFEHGLVELDWQLAAAGHASNRSRLLVGAAAVVLVGGLGVIVVTRGTPAQSPSNPALPFDTGAVTTRKADDPVVDTAPATTVQGSGQTPACPDGTGTIGTGTLYLGGPAWEQNLAAQGFIFSLPAGTAPVDVAVKAIALPVIGLECSITGRPNAGGSVVTVTVNPPAVPAPLQIDVHLSERAGAIGVIAISSNTGFETNVGDAATLKLLDGVPTSTVRVQVRFKKGDDVWELTADPTVGNNIALVVPAGEADRFPDEPVDWVLFTLLDTDDHVVGVGGGVL